jgi:tetratricopeptide (TPR) repeat protein
MQNPDLPPIQEAWNYAKPEESELRFAELALLGYEAGDTLYALEAQTQQARAMGMQQKFEEAHAKLDEIEGRIPSDNKLQIRFFLERGRVFNSSQKKPEAMEQFKLAMELAKKLNEDYLAIDAVHMLGIADEPDAALKWNMLAIQMAEESTDERVKKWLGPLYNNTGWTLHDQGDYGEAFDLFEKSLEWNIENGNENSINIARWTVGRGKRSLKEYADALEIQLELLEEGYESGFVYEEIGECMLLLGQEEKAKPYFKTAYEKLKDDGWLVKYESERLERLKELCSE